LSEITCDGAILKTLFNGDLQTTRYSTIDQYATTYKGISLRGKKTHLYLMVLRLSKSNFEFGCKGTPLNLL
jgi:hypothetical protein